MAWDDEDDGEPGGSGPPLPPEDRLWRHPSELGSQAVAAQPLRQRRSAATVAMAGALAGALAATALMALAGGLPTRTIERAVVEKVALTPVVSSPIVPDDRSVAALAEHLGPAVVRLEVDRGEDDQVGSGVIVRDDGLLLTSAALVDGARSIEGVLSDGRRLAAALIGADHVTEVAVVDLAGSGHAVAVLGSAEDLDVGAPAVVIGAALGGDGWPSATTGVISALARQIRTVDGGWLHGMIQTDAPIAQLADGAALVDERGAVVGIATTAALQSSGRFGFATPIDVARQVAHDLEATGRTRHAWLGVAADDLSPGDAAEHGVATGVQVQEVSTGSPAAAAGLVPGDVITDLDGEAVTSMSMLVMALRDRAPGAMVEVGYRRDGVARGAQLTLVERP